MDGAALKIIFICPWPSLEANFG